MTNKDNEQAQVVRRLYAASILCLIFMCIELAGGYVANSLAIMSDAAHLFSDLAAFLVSICAAHLASLPSTSKHTFGLKRVESLAALFSMGSLALVCVYLAIQALVRLQQFANGTMEEVDGKFMSIIATIGVLVNLALAWVLGGAHPELPGGGHGHAHDHGSDDHGHGDAGDDHGDHEHEDHKNHDHGSHDHGSHDHGAHDHASHEDESTPLAGAVAAKKEPRNVNLNAAYLHVLGDLLQSFAVLVAGIIIWLVPDPRIRVLDPIATLVFCVLVFYATVGVMRACVAVILEEVPPDVSWEVVYEDLSAVDGVSHVHDLHIWSISQGVPALSVHCRATDPERALADITRVLRKKHKIVHATAQVERGTGDGCLTEHDKRCYMAA